MKPHAPAHPCHTCAPKLYRHTPQITGSYELDAGIARNGNKNLPARVAMFVEPNDNIYGSKTGYSGYHGYSGDD